ncbi:pseudouridine synthase [Specibacter cremeus]|uniref:pseudouridine synthase n=1 Tax=Specibacter cremeus TaxID=1629051 RepID=UPI000F7847A2|nr:pseudouridine synthase [Specibacter cremeus]
MTPTPRSGGSAGQHQPRGGKPRAGGARPVTGASGFGKGHAGGGKATERGVGQGSGQGTAKGTGYPKGKGTGKAPGTSTYAKKRQRDAAKIRPNARAFGNERFGQNLGPVKNRAVEANRQAERTTDEVDLYNPGGVRLQKVLAGAGVASRRVCEDLILEGRVQVDGVTVTELGLRVDPETAVISVDGMTVQLNESLIYMVFNKPRGVVSTMNDPEGRPCISDFLKKRYHKERLFHVGRLDANTEGLLLLTNDGELANRLTHPKYEVPKTYVVQVRGPMAHGVGQQLKDGVELEDGWSRVDSFRLVDSTPGHVLVEVVLHSGKNRIVRRMFSAVGYPVERLVRIKFGPISIGDQRQGSMRLLGRQEIGHLLAAVGM